MINGDDLGVATDPAEGGLLRASQAPMFTHEDRIETLFLATLSRMPTSDERSLYLATSRLPTRKMIAAKH